ncbi:MAG: hypothetical protein RR657_01620 [Peptostreptococcaceae bacterium]
MNFIYNITADGWISFIGSILSFVGVFITISCAKKQFKDDKKISVKPYLDMKLKNDEQDLDFIDSITINKFKSRNGLDRQNINVEITNLGQGNCLECKLIEIKLNGNKVNNEVRYIGNIETNKNILSGITFKTWYEDILQEIREKYIGKDIKDCPDDFKSFSHRCFLKEIELKFEYKDILENKYSKKIVIETYIYFNILTEKYIWQVSDIEYNFVLHEINGNLTTEKTIKKKWLKES